MKRLTFAAPILIALLAAACGGGDDDEGPTPTYTVAGGVNTSLPRHLTGVSPEQASTVTNADLHIGEEQASGGVCAYFDFNVGETMGDNPGERVSLFVGQEDVTNSAAFVIAMSNPPSLGTICYASPQPFEAGEVLATVRYSDATDRQFIYNWTFTVAESATASP